MPARNAIKTYVENGYYHLYNRGVEKRLIFLERQDHGVFLGYLKEYLMPKDEEKLRKQLSDPQTSYKDKDRILKKLRLNNFYNDIELLAYCLMPNHFHFAVKQHSATTIDRFIQSLCTRYTMYFNKKYKRVGSLFQSVYKAVMVTSEEQLLHLTRYIHKQALASQGETLEAQPSSYEEYLGKRKTAWITAQPILTYFNKDNPRLSYEAFVKESEDHDFLTHISLDLD